jgi:hypothetical protein
VRPIWAPWLGFAFICLLLVTALLIGVSDGYAGIATLVFVLANGAVGALVASRLPRHPVGWLLLGTSACFAIGGVLVTYIEQAVNRSFPLSPLLVISGDWSFGLGVALASTFVLLFFPTGRLPSPRWRWVAWLAGLGTLMLLVGVALSPSTFEGLAIDNPWALPPDDWRGLIFEGGGLIVLLGGMLAAMGSMILRFRSGGDVERRQLKWVLFAVVVAVIGIAGTYVIELVNGASDLSDDLENTVIAFGLALVPIAIGLAILRYRLYDIDRLVSRTVSYALVVGLIGAIVLGLVGGLAMFLPSDDPLVVAVATLVAFGLFNPLRLRVQAAVDRRFNRSRYDTERVIEGFAGSLRESIEPGRLVDGWIGVVEQTMQPAAVGLWVRDTG